MSLSTDCCRGSSLGKIVHLGFWSSVRNLSALLYICTKLRSCVFSWLYFKMWNAILHVVLITAVLSIKYCTLCSVLCCLNHAAGSLVQWMTYSVLAWKKHQSARRSPHSLLANTMHKVPVAPQRKGRWEFFTLPKYRGHPPLPSPPLQQTEKALARKLWFWTLTVLAGFSWCICAFNVTTLEHTLVYACGALTCLLLLGLLLSSFGRKLVPSYLKMSAKWKIQYVK